MNTQATTASEAELVTPVPDPATEGLTGATRRVSALTARAHLPPWARAGSPAWIWAGIAVAAGGFGLIALAWGQTASEIQVYRQVPYVVSAGLVGLGLVLVGLTILNVASRDRDEADHHQQLQELIDVIDELRDTLDARGSGRA